MALTEKECDELYDSVAKKHIAMEKRAKERIKQAGVDANSNRAHQIHAEEVGKMLAEMTPEERREHRQASELGCLPGDTGGGFDVLYVPDDGEDH